MQKTNSAFGKVKEHFNGIKPLSLEQSKEKIDNVSMNDEKTEITPKPKSGNSKSIKEQPAISKEKNFVNVDFSTELKMLCNTDFTMEARLKKIKEGKNTDPLPIMIKFGLIDENFKPHSMIEEAIKRDITDKGDEKENWQKSRDSDLMLKHAIGGIVLLNNQDVFKKLAALSMRLDIFNEYLYSAFYHTQEKLDDTGFKQIENEIEQFLEKCPNPKKEDLLSVFKEKTQGKVENPEKYFDSANSYARVYTKFWRYFCPQKNHFDTYKFLKFTESSKPFTLEESKKFFEPNIVVPRDKNKFENAIKYIEERKYENDNTNGLGLENSCYQLCYAFKEYGYQVEAKGIVNQDNVLVNTAGGGLHDIQVVGKNIAILVEPTVITGRNQIGAEQNIIEHLFKSKFNKPTYLVFVAPEFSQNTKPMLSAYFDDKKSKSNNKNLENIVFMSCDEFAHFVKQEVAQDKITDERLQAMFDVLSYKDNVKLKRKM